LWERIFPGSGKRGEKVVKSLIHALKTDLSPGKMSVVPLRTAIPAQTTTKHVILAFLLLMTSRILLFLWMTSKQLTVCDKGA
jgi:hypothetical protein